MGRSRTKPKKMKKKKTNQTEKRPATEMNRIQATMDDLPELPFEKVLSYLSLEDRLKARAVSKCWYTLINSFKVKTLCYSTYPSGFIEEKGRWVSGAYAQNFISSPRFASFFDTFGHSILSNLKHLRICHLYLNTEDNKASIAPTLNMFGRLEELDIIRLTCPGAASSLGRDVELNLPMLASIRLEEVNGIDQLTLEAPRLKRIKLLEFPPSLRLKLVHADSVEWLATENLAHVEVKNLTSLKCLHCEDSSEIDATFLSGLEQLKEVHLQEDDFDLLLQLFEQKQRYGRTDLKIFLDGFLLNSPDDPAIDSFDYPEEFFVHLSKNPSRLADEIPLWTDLDYSAIDGVAPESAINILSRFTDLNAIDVDSSVQDVQRFLDLLKNFPNIVFLEFFVDQPQDLFDRLPEHSAIQHLIIDHPVSDLRFLFRLEHLIFLEHHDQITAEVIRTAFKELHFLLNLAFKHLDQQVQIGRSTTNHWMVSIGEKKTDVSDLNSVIQLVFG